MDMAIFIAKNCSRWSKMVLLSAQQDFLVYWLVSTGVQVHWTKKLGENGKNEEISIFQATFASLDALEKC